MYGFAGFQDMLLLAGISGVVLGILGLGLARVMGPISGFAWAGFLWSLIVIGLVTLLPTQNDPGLIPVESAQTSCSWEVGGPAPDGFWIFDGGQRSLNTALFVPSGLTLVLALSHRLWSVLLGTPFGLAALCGYSACIEKFQLEVARIGRACDVTDMVDNMTGAAFGVGIGLVVATVLAPGRYWFRRRRRHPRARREPPPPVVEPGPRAEAYPQVEPPPHAPHEPNPTQPLRAPRPREDDYWRPSHWE